MLHKRLYEIYECRHLYAYRQQVNNQQSLATSNLENSIDFQKCTK